MNFCYLILICYFKRLAPEKFWRIDICSSWKIHKKQTGCTASRMKTILVKNNNAIGFKCDCGFNYLQKRLITQKSHFFTKTNIAPQVSHKIMNHVETKRSLQKMGVEYSQIQKI